MTGPEPAAPLRFSVVMPAYNEQDVIEATVDALVGHLRQAGYEAEIVIVDDASKDGTAQRIAALEARHPCVRGIHNPGPNGYGHAIRTGLAAYTGDAVVIVTSDASDSPADVVRYFARIREGYDCAFGDRFAEGATVTNYPRLKLRINRMANWLVGRLVGTEYRDFTNGFKCYRREVIDSLQPIISGQFNITIELSVSTLLAGWRCAVVPTDWAQREAGESSFSIRKLLKPYGATLTYCLCRNYIQSIKR